MSTTHEQREALKAKRNALPDFERHLLSLTETKGIIEAIKYYTQKKGGTTEEARNFIAPLAKEYGVSTSIPKGCYVVLLIIGLSALMYFGSNNKNESSRNEDMTSSKTLLDAGTSDTYKAPPKDYQKDIDFKLYVLDTSMDRATLRNTKVDILAEVDLFESTAALINSTPDTVSGGTKTKLEKLKAQLMKIQIADFPVLRAHYAKWAGQQVWENNMDVECNGPNVTFISGIFANRANIKKMQEGIVDILARLRFKRANYKWVKHEEEYTYFTIDSKSDKAL